MKFTSGLDTGELPIADQFTDRVPESQALTRSLTKLRDDIAADRLDGIRNDNVLTFYGEGGIGKTTLSKRLETWLLGNLSGDSHWRTPPAGRFVTVRWDLRNAEDNSDPTNFLLDLRQRLGGHTPLAFDVALTALFAKRRPGVLQDEQEGLRTKAVLGVADVVAQSLEIAHWAVGIGGLGLPALARMAVKKVKGHIARSQAEVLEPLLDYIDSHGDDARKLPAIAGEMMTLVMQHIYGIPEARRPMIVCFIDTYEKAQEDATGQIEALVNSIVARSPLALFVVTGRNRLRWHEARGGMHSFGPERWPSLGREPGDGDPYQHLVGHLSELDTVALLQTELQRLGIKLSDEAVGQLARDSHGHPVHIDTMLVAARKVLEIRSADSVTAADLGGSHSITLRRVLEHLDPATSRRALLAAAVTPTFDVELVANIAGVEEGIVREVVRESLVSTRRSDFFPFHLHDQTRELLRVDDEGSPWTPNDWTAAAERALAHLEERYESAKEAENYVAQVHVHALAVRIAVEHGLLDAWPTRKMALSPSHELLGQLLVGVEAEPGSEMAGHLLFLRAFVPDVAERERLMRDLAERLQPSSKPASKPYRRALLWRAYVLRDLGRYDEALAELQKLCTLEPTHRLNHEQIVHTLSQARRFVEAQTAFEALGQEEVPVNDGILHGHGRLIESITALDKRLAYAEQRRRSTRIRLHMQARREALKFITGMDDPAKRTALFQQSVDLQQSIALRWLAIPLVATFAKTDDFHAAWDEADAQVGFLSNPENGPDAALLAGIRMLATGDETWMNRCVEAGIRGGHSSRWIPAEMLWRHLGWELDEYPSQWLEPESVVRERWIGIFQALVDRL